MAALQIEEKPSGRLQTSMDCMAKKAGVTESIPRPLVRNCYLPKMRRNPVPFNSLFAGLAPHTGDVAIQFGGNRAFYEEEICRWNHWRAIQLEFAPSKPDIGRGDFALSLNHTQG